MAVDWYALMMAVTTLKQHHQQAVIDQARTLLGGEIERCRF